VLGGQLLGHGRQHDVPEGQHRAAALHHPGGARERPEVEVLAAVASARQVGAGHSGDRLHGRTEPLHQGAEGREHLERRILQPSVLVGRQTADERDSHRLQRPEHHCSKQESSSSTSGRPLGRDPIGRWSWYGEPAGSV
jgi:hypothetical protein